MKPNNTLAIAIVLTAGIANAEEQPVIPYLDPVAVASGAEIYSENCASCHGDDLQGEDDWQTVKDDGMRAAPPHDETGHTWHHADALLFDLTKNGLTAIMARRGMDYSSDMIGFGDALSDEEILAVLAFIKSTWPQHVIDMHDKINASQ